MPQDPWAVVSTKPLTPASDPWAVVATDGKPIGITMPPKDTRNVFQKWFDDKADAKDAASPEKIDFTNPDKVAVAQQMKNSRMGAVSSDFMRMVAHPLEHAPEIGAMLATLPLGGEGAAAVRVAKPAIGALRAGLGSLAGSAVKETPKVISGEKSGSDAALSAATSAGMNAGGQYLGERFLTGLTPVIPGTPGAARAAEFAQIPKGPNGEVPLVSAATVMGPKSGMLNGALGLIEKLSERFLGGSAVASRGNAQASEMIGKQLAAIPEVSHIQPAQKIGTQVRGAFADDAARTADIAASKAAQNDTARAASHSAIESQLQDLKAKGATGDFLGDNSARRQWKDFEAAAPDLHAAVDQFHDAVAAMHTSPTAASEIAAQKRVIAPLLRGAPEHLVKALGLEDVSAAQSIARVTKDNPALKKSFTDAWMDRKIFKDANGNVDLTGTADRLSQAANSGVLKELLPAKTAGTVIDRMRVLADIAKDIAPPVQSYGHALRVASVPGEAAAGVLSSAGSALKSKLMAGLAVSELSSVSINAMLRSPVTRRILMDGLTDTNGARAASTIIRALQLANSMKPSASHEPTIPEPPK